MAMREVQRINHSHLPRALMLAAQQAVEEAIRVYESKDDAAERLEFGLEHSDIATVLYIKHADGQVTSRDLRGNRGRRGRLGVTGVPGVMGREGKVGPRGEEGELGPAGPRGLSFKGIDGRQGVPGPQGVPGLKGEKGEKGDAPEHEWQGTKLRFRNSDGSWGRFIMLQGMIGGRGRAGADGAGGGTTAFVQELLNRARSMAFFLGEG